MRGGAANKAADSGTAPANIETCKVLLDGPAGYHCSTGAGAARATGTDGKYAFDKTVGRPDNDNETTRMVRSLSGKILRTFVESIALVETT